MIDGFVATTLSFESLGQEPLIALPSLFSLQLLQIKSIFNFSCQFSSPLVN